MNKFAIYGWNKILRVRLSFLKLHNAILRKERNRAKRQLQQFKYLIETGKNKELSSLMKEINNDTLCSVKDNKGELKQN